MKELKSILKTLGFVALSLTWLFGWAIMLIGNPVLFTIASIAWVILIENTNPTKSIQS